MAGEAGALAFEYFRNDLRLQHFEFALVAEEFGNADQQVIEEVLGLVLVVPEAIDVGGNLVDLAFVNPLGEVVTVAFRPLPLYVCDKLPSVTVAVALPTASVLVALPW